MTMSVPATSPSVVDAPPPWRLQGQGYVLLLRVSGAADRSSPALDGRFDGGLGALLLVDYTASDVGPYRELVFIPGNFRVPGGRARVVTRIWVTSEASVRGGRQHWGMPKELAQARWDFDGSLDRIEFSLGVRSVAAFELARPTRLGFPISSALLPRRARSLTQPWEGRWLRTAAKAKGRVARAELVRRAWDPELLPELDRAELLGAFYSRRFDLVFPAAKVLP